MKKNYHAPKTHGIEIETTIIAASTRSSAPKQTIFTENVEQKGSEWGNIWNN